jgi:iron(III) transport system ATP-binding protein
MLLDEPFSHLDRHLAGQVRDEAMQVLRAAGATVLVVTHDQEEALAVGDRVAVLRAGRMVQVGAPEELFHRPADQFVASLLGEADFVPGTRHGATASSSLGALPVTTGPNGAVQVMVRPHDLTVRLAGDPETAPGGLGVVRRVEFRGGDVLHHVTLDDGTLVRARTSHTHAVPVDARVVVPTPVAHPLAAFPMNEPG